MHKGFVNSPDNPPWPVAAALAVWLVSVLLMIVCPLLFLVTYAAFKGYSASDLTGISELMKTDSTAIVINILAVLPAHLLTLLVAWSVVTLNGRRPFLENLGWTWNGFKAWHGLLILVGFFAISSVVTYFVPEQEHELMKILKSSRSAVYAVTFLATFTAPAVEEVVYRGLLYSSFTKAIGKAASVVLVTLLFAIIHVPQYRQSYATIILIFLLSLMLTLVRMRTESLLPCVVLHLIFNGLQSMRLLADPLIEQMNRTAPDAAALLRLF